MQLQRFFVFVSNKVPTRYINRLYYTLICILNEAKSEELKTNNILQQHHGNTLYTKLQLLLPVGSDQFEYINNMKSDYEATIFFSLCLIFFTYLPESQK
jgi:hypothetical protein